MPADHSRFNTPPGDGTDSIEDPVAYMPDYTAVKAESDEGASESDEDTVMAQYSKACENCSEDWDHPIADQQQTAKHDTIQLLRDTIRTVHRPECWQLGASWPDVAPLSWIKIRGIDCSELISKLSAPEPDLADIWYTLKSSSNFEHHPAFRPHRLNLEICGAHQMGRSVASEKISEYIRASQAGKEWEQGLIDRSQTQRLICDLAVTTMASTVILYAPLMCHSFNSGSGSTTVPRTVPQAL